MWHLLHSISSGFTIVLTWTLIRYCTACAANLAYFNQMLLLKMQHKCIIIESFTIHIIVQHAESKLSSKEILSSTMLSKFCILHSSTWPMICTAHQIDFCDLYIVQHQTLCNPLVINPMLIKFSWGSLSSNPIVIEFCSYIELFFLIDVCTVVEMHIYLTINL